MVIRELKDGCCWVSTQEDHAELSAQFAAHWGNGKPRSLPLVNSHRKTKDLRCITKHRGSY
jgi:hypothetical protein